MFANGQDASAREEDGGRRMTGKTKKKSSRAPPHVKYPQYLTPEEERLALLNKPTPSMIMEEMSSQGRKKKLEKRAAPEIIEFMGGDCSNTSVPVDNPLFQPYPLHLQFRDYAEFGVYKQTLYFRNNDNVARHMRIQKTDSQYFSVRPHVRSTNCVAPGMEISYEVTFKPQKKKDYHEKLICVTDREKFIVEVSALGPWACVDFPDEVGFGTCPVNHTTERTFLVRNVGERDTCFTLSTTQCFDTKPASGFIRQGDTMQITAMFSPDTCTNHDGEVQVTYENGQTSYIHVHGSAENLNVNLDKPIAEVEPAYITLTSTCSVRIENDSDIPVNFSWKTFFTHQEEAEERTRLHKELDRLEEEEYEQVAQTFYPDDHPESYGDDEEDDEESSSDELCDESLMSSKASGERRRRRVPLAKRRDLAALKQKYRNLRRAVNEDDLLFADENFSIDPLCGQVWSHSSKDVTVTFRPQIAADYVSIACLSVSGREHRLPFKIMGQGIGPKACFAFQTVDVGKVFIHTNHQFHLKIENKGSIPCEFSLDESLSPYTECIKFNPARGVLDVDSSRQIDIDFAADILGDFMECFTFSMHGSSEKMKCKFKGSVIGPTFDINVSELNFERVPYGFCNTKIFNLKNTSSIPMEYVFRVPGDGKFDEPEFILTPSEGEIPPGGEQVVQLDFTSKTIMRYQMKLILDIPGIGKNIHEIPIRAECTVGNVLLFPTTERIPPLEEGAFDFADEEDPDEVDERDVGEESLSFGNCFIRFPYVLPLILRNSSDIRAHFEIQKQDPATYSIASYEPAVHEGFIEPMSEIRVNITLKCEKLGKLALPLYVKIMGSDKPAMMIDVVAIARGPKVEVSSTDIDFGNVQCLEMAKRKFTLKNNSCIPAAYRAFLKNPKSRFNIDSLEGCLGPFETLECETSVCPDDSVVLREELHIFIAEGANIIVPLRAKGVGTTMFCEHIKELKTLSFDSVFTSRPHEKKFLLENRGRRDQSIVWTNTTFQEKMIERNRLVTNVERLLKDKDPEVQKRASRMRIPPEPKPAFTVYPESVVLKPRMGCMFTVRGEYELAGVVEENLRLDTKVGKEKMSICVVKSKAKATFVNPLLHASVDLIEFCYTFHPEEVGQRNGDKTHMTQRRPFKLKNIAQLPLNFILRTQEPFSVDTWEISLEPNEEVTVTVMFDPYVSDDLKTQTVLGKLVAVHQNHPQKDVFDIRAQINFPNLDFECEEIDFGCIMNETSKSVKVKVSNNSIIDTMYSWVFVEDDEMKPKSPSKQLKKYLPNEIFDIRPIRGLLRPGESQEIEVSYFGHSNRKFNITAVCEVEGGPDYEITLKGEASDVSFRLDQEYLEFGELVHDKVAEKEFTISNTSKVAFEYRAICSRPDIMSCSPSEGRVLPKDIQKINVTFTPGVPDKIAEHIMLEIAHFEPFSFPVYGTGTFASISLSLPRQEDIVLSKWKAIHDQLEPDDSTPNAFLVAQLEKSVATRMTPASELLDEAEEWARLYSQAESIVVPRRAGTPVVELLSPGDDLLEGRRTAPSEEKTPYELDTLLPSTAPEASVDFIGSSSTIEQSTTSQVLGRSQSKPTNSSSNISTSQSKRAKGSRRGNRFDQERVRIEREANRLKFVDFLNSLEPSERELLVPGSRPSTSHTNKISVAPPGAPIPDSGIFKLSKYLLDFGNIVVGKSRKKSFKILNTCDMSVTLDIQRVGSSVNNQFGVEPRRVTRLPEGESAELAVQYTAKKGTPLGLAETKFLLDIRSGPPIELVLRANVTMPDVSVSTELITFDPLLVGRCKVFTLQFQNISPVPVEWSFAAEKSNGGSKDKRGVDKSGASGDLRFFSCSPSSGSLQPNQRGNVEISFAPGEKGNFQAKLPFRVRDNPKPKIITCIGEGDTYSLEITDELQTMPPTLPAIADSAVREFKITNTSNGPVEVFSVDFDDQYIMEEKVIHKVLDHTEMNILVPTKTQMRTIPRYPGEPLQQSIMQMYKDTMREEQELPLGEVGELETDGEPNQDESIVQSGPTYRDRGLALDTIVLGPPLSDYPLLSQEISKMSGEVSVLTLDDIVVAAAKAGNVPEAICAHYDLESNEPTKKKVKKTSPMTVEVFIECLRSKLKEYDVSRGLVLNGLKTRFLESPGEIAKALHDAFLVPAPEIEQEEEDGTPTPLPAPEESVIQNKLRVVVLDISKDDLETMLSSEQSTDEDRLNQIAAIQEDPSILETYYSSQEEVLSVLCQQDTPTEDQEEEVKEEVQPLVVQTEEVVNVLRIARLEDANHALAGWLPRPGTPLTMEQLDEFYLAIPPEITYQLVARPPRRNVRKPVKRFALETIGIVPNDQALDTSEEGTSEEGTSEESTPEEGKQEALKTQTRWIIPENSTLNLRIRFNSMDVGTFEQQLSFEMVGGQRTYWVVSKGTCAVPTISADPRNVFMSRIKSRPEHKLVSKKFVMATGVYEFGSLLIGRNQENRNEDEDLKVRNCETFRISNSGILPIDQVDFSFLLGEADLAEGGLVMEDPSLLPFLVEPSTLQLDPGETKDISIWAFPQHIGTFKARLVACIKDNPEVVEFKVSCVGASPSLAINGPWDDIPKDVIEQEEPPAKGKAKGGAKGGAKKQETPEITNILDFDRLLLGRNEERSFSVQNTSTIPVQWDLNLGDLSEVTEFTVLPTEGVLAPGSTATITVGFEAKERSAHEHNLKVRFTDTENGMDDETRVKTVDVVVKAEAYDIQVRPCFKQEGDPVDEQGPGFLDFGTIRVFEFSTRNISLENVGKYAINYRFQVRRKSTRELIKIEPSEGTLESGEKGTFLFKFRSQSEAHLRNNKDIQCIIMEPKTEQVVETFEIPVRARSLFSSFRIHPVKGIHFGAVKFHAEPEKTFEIRNDGEFEFSYKILNLQDFEAKQKQFQIDFDEGMKKELQLKQDGGTLPDETFEQQTQRKYAMPDETIANAKEHKDALALGMFNITPVSGIIPPGGTQQIHAKFNAQGDLHGQEKVQILISGRPPFDGNLLSGIPFEFAGESHIPGINTVNYESIFEEQAIVRTLDPETNEKGVFSSEERTFSFGAVIHTSVPSKGICERFKISNPNKIKAIVNFSVEPRNDQSKDIFSVHPTNLELPSHEYEFVSVYFKPNAMSKYSAKFTATVVDGEKSPLTSMLAFDLQGEGTLPCLTIVEPSTLSDNAKFTVDHGRTQVGKTKSKQISIRNDGIVPATVRYDMALHDSFSFPLRNSSLTLRSKEVHTTTISFCPQTEGDHSCELFLRVLHNEFELSRFHLCGVGYQEDITFENLPDTQEDALCFNDVALRHIPRVEKGTGEEEEEEKEEEADEYVAEKVLSFTVRSNCSDPIRYEWNNSQVPQISFSPSVGHISPFGLVEIEAKILTDSPCTIDGQEKAAALIKFEKIQYTEEAFAQANGKSIHWDDRMMAVVSSSPDETAEGDESVKLQAAPEPAHTILEGSEKKELRLPCEAQVDFVTYTLAEGATDSIQFRPTMMFQSRVFKYAVANEGKIAMNLSWKIQDLGPVGENGVPKTTHCPFSITPKQANIDAGTEQVFTVRFSPLEVENFEFEAFASIADLKKTEAPLVVKLGGVARRPICHFEIDPCNYLERRKSDLPPLVGVENAKVIEFQSLGVRVKNTKRFHIVNPMNLSYEFELTPIEDINPKFKCTTQKGVILPGKRYEIVFSFVPEDVQLQESIWKFTIPEQNVTQVLLLVGSVLEPKVELDKKHVNFHSVLVGGQSSETVTLQNNEAIPFAFSFDASSFVNLENNLPGDSNRELSKAKKTMWVEPMSGSVAANSSTPITIHFSPGGERSHNYNLVCVVHRKPNRLSLNVKGEGSAIHDRLVLENGPVQEEEDEESGSAVRGKDLVLTSGDKSSNVLDFGQVHVNDRESREIKIYNRGKFSFDFVWTPPVGFSDPGGEDSILSLSPMKGTVPCGECITCVFKFYPKQEILLDNVKFQCTVAGARKYNVDVCGRGSKPLVTFSSYQLNFGPCFIAEHGASSRTEELTLTISNNETDSPVYIDCLHEKTEFLDVSCERTVLQPGESINVQVHFTPRELTEYRGSIPFELNGLYTVNVLYTGEGAVLRLELEKPEDQIINFGSLRVGHKSTRQFKLVNRSKRATSFRLMEREEAGQGRLQQHAVHFTHNSLSAISLRPRESCVVTLAFSPEHRLSPFSETLFIQVDGAEKKLLTVTGSCQAMDVKLEASSLNFGSVCESCQLTKKVQVHNAGDLGATFRWEMKQGKTDFCIFPMEGFLPPHAQLMIDVKFVPSRIAEEIRSDVRLLVDGNETPVMPLALMGSCLPQPEEGIKSLQFKSKVRDTETQTVQISNPSKTTWLLQPTIHNKYWSGPERLEVPAGGSASYELLYCPLTMTLDAQVDGDEGKTSPSVHEGSVFFALPNGTAILYKLLGKADPPNSEGTIEETVASKKSISIPMKVKNWFRTAQRMNVRIEKLSGTPDHFFKGPRTLDIPANNQRNYKLGFVGYLPGTSEAKVTFTNSSTGEYLFYMVKLKVEAPEVQSIIRLESPVRQKTCTIIAIENPFHGTQVNVAFEPENETGSFESAVPSCSWWKCDSPYVRVRALNVFSENREGTFEIEYRPLIPTTDYVSATLTLESPQLGSYPYELKLRATQPSSERSLHFHSTLGAAHEQVFRFKQFSGKPTEYKCKVGQPLFFEVPATLKASAAETWYGAEEAISVRFEPQGLGEVRDVLTVQSADGGEYSCSLYGVCEPPRPQGPFLIEDAGKGTAITFKNIFASQRQFRFIVDSDDFTVNGSRSQTIKIDASKQVSVTVKSTPTATVGKMLVSCVELPDLPAWTYYIKNNKN